MTRVHPNEAMRLVLRRLNGHDVKVEQSSDGDGVWYSHCPAHDGRVTGPVITWKQSADGRVTVGSHRVGGTITCDATTVLAALAIDDVRIAAANGYKVKSGPFVKPARTKRTDPSGVDSYEILEKLRAALQEGGYAGNRARTDRYTCPSCGEPGNGRGLRITHNPNAVGKRKILLICDKGRCPVEDILEPLGMTVAEVCAADDVDDLDEGVRPDPDDRPKKKRVATDLANARQLAGKFGDRLRYVVPWKKWLIWDGTRWAQDETGEAVRCAKAIADKSRDDAARSRYGIEAMLALAATEPGIAIAPAHLDADPYLLNVANGTVDLRTGELRPHDRDDLITKATRAAFHPDAQAPEFVRFLERVQPDEVMRDFLARLVGHSLLGKVVEHLLPVFYGIGANGKTTLVEAVAHALGDYADTVEPGLLIDRGEVHPTGVADLFKLRLAVTHETDEGRRLAEGTVKRLTGGDRVKARRMREDFWSFDPSHSLIMHTNHKPLVRGTDEGIWRRLRFVPFAVVIPEDERDGKLPERLAGEADGILAWCVAGFRQWQDRGLAAPQTVIDATASFRTESDLLALFLDERCMQNAHSHVRSSELFGAWVDWCKRENVDAGTQTAFSRKLTERGFDKTKDGRGSMVWQGITLYAEESGQ